MTFRVVQWATGQVGKAAIRATIEHPKLELVGAYVYSEAKHGVDIGEIAGIAPLGTTATASVDEILSIPADVVLYTPKAEPSIEVTVAEVCRILRSGRNVVATALMALFGRTVPQPYGAEIEQACLDGSSSFLSTGIQPGFFMDTLPAVISSNAAGVRHVMAREIYHYAHHAARATVVDFLDIGKPLAVKEATIATRRTMCEPVMRLLAAIIHAKIDEVDLEYELVGADETFVIAATTVEKGTLAAYRRIYRGKSAGTTRFTFDYVHRAAPHVAPHWPYPRDPAGLQWSGAIDGRPPLHFAVDVDASTPEAIHPGSQMVGHRAVTAAPVVCAAKPGIVTPFDLIQPTGYLPADLSVGV